MFFFSRGIVEGEQAKMERVGYEKEMEFIFAFIIIICVEKG